MKEFICLSCGMKWYSAASIDEPCANCGGLLQETGLQQYNEPRRFELVVNRPKLHMRPKTKSLGNR